MNHQQLDKFQIDLNIAEGILNEYWAFAGEATIKIVKEDTIKGLCKELMDWEGYCQFKKQRYETQRDIVRTIIENKKRDNVFTYVNE